MRRYQILFTVPLSCAMAPLLSGYLRRHEVGTPLLRALIIGGAVGLLVFAALALEEPDEDRRPPRAPSWAVASGLGALMLIASLVIEKLTL